MKVVLAVLALIATCLGCSPGGAYEPRDGDIVFHVSRSQQSLAIQRATGSPYSHLGIVYPRDGQPYVFEAVQPVKFTALDDWIARGDRHHYVVKRLRDAEAVLTPEVTRRMIAAGEPFLGRDYDLFFEWSDDRIYCSELVWKIFQRGAGIELGRLESLGDFDLTDPQVQRKVRERFGANLPLGKIVLSMA